MKNYYDPTVTEEAARLMVEVADKYRGNNNFEYDLVDIVRQSLSDKGRIVYNRTIADFKALINAVLPVTPGNSWIYCCCRINCWVHVVNSV